MPNVLIPTIIPPFIPSFDFSGSLGKRFYKGKQRKKYQPSYEAMVFKIFGKQPKGLETGARLRPIPKGYSFAFKTSPIQFKVPKLNIRRFKLWALKLKRAD